MTILRLNREFATRHIAVAALMLGMGGWFGYDGYVNYPQQDDAFFETRHLKRENAIERQKEFMILAFLAAVIISGHVIALARFDFGFDDDGFVVNGVRHGYDEIESADFSLWEKKGIVSFKAGNRKYKLDAWHHTGVKSFAERIKR